MSTRICNYSRKNRNFLIPWCNIWVILSQILYSGGLQYLHGNAKFLSLFLAPTSNLPAQLPHIEVILEPATCRCTPRCLNPKVSVPHWIQLWGWISGLQPFLAFNASTPLQKLKLTWKTHYVPLLLHHLSGWAICYAAGWNWHTQNQIYTTSLSWSPEDAVSQEKVPTDGPSLNHSWGQILTSTSSYSELLLGNWVINVGLAQGLWDTTEKQNKVLSPCCGHVQIKTNNFLIVYGYVLRYFLVIVWLFSVLWCYVDEVLIAWVKGSPHWLLPCALSNNQERRFPQLKRNMSPMLWHTPSMWSSVSQGCSHKDCPPCVTQKSSPVAGGPLLDDGGKARNLVLSIISFHWYLFQNTTSSLMERSYWYYSDTSNTAPSPDSLSYLDLA